MNNLQASGHSVALAVVALFAGILIGIVGAGVYSVDEQVTPGANDTSGISETQSQYHAALSAQLQAHAILAINALRAEYDNRGDAPSATIALEENSQTLASTLGAVYGSDAEEEFNEIWSGYVEGLVEYTEAARDDDREALASAQERLNGYPEELSVYLSELTEASQGELEDLLGDYLERLLQSVNSYAAGNYDESYEVQQTAVEQMSALADSLTTAIVQSESDQF